MMIYFQLQTSELLSLWFILLDFVLSEYAKQYTQQ